MTGFVRSQCLNIGAAGTAAVMALTVVSVPPGRGGSLEARPEIVAVQLQAAIATGVAALVNSAPGCCRRYWPGCDTGDIQ